MAEGYTDEDFKKIVKEFLKEAREDAKDLVLRSGQIQEYGDEFGDVDLGNFSDFKKIFIEPFKDVAKTTLGHLSKVSSSARTGVEKFLRGIPTLIVPFLSAQYDDIYAREDQRLATIRSKYGDVFARTNEIFKGGDAQLVAFMLNPGMMLASIATKETAEAVLDTADALAGQSPGITQRTTHIRQTLSLSSAASESTLRRLVFEEEGDENVLSDTINDPEFQRTINNSPKARELKTSTQQALNQTLNDFRHDAQQISAADSFEAISKHLGKKVDPPVTAGMKPEEIAKTFAILLTQFKNAYIDGITSGLKMSTKEFERLNVPEGADIVKVFGKVINEIDGMKK